MSSADKLNLLQHAVGATPSDAYTRFIQLVLKQKRETLLQNMALMYIDLYREAHHIVVGFSYHRNCYRCKNRGSFAKETNTRQGRNAWIQHSCRSRFDRWIRIRLRYLSFDASIATQLKRMKAEFMDQNKNCLDIKYGRKYKTKWSIWCTTPTAWSNRYEASTRRSRHSCFRLAMV